MDGLRILFVIILVIITITSVAIVWFGVLPYLRRLREKRAKQVEKQRREREEEDARITARLRNKPFLVLFRQRDGKKTDLEVTFLSVAIDHKLVVSDISSQKFSTSEVIELKGVVHSFSWSDFSRELMIGVDLRAYDRTGQILAAGYFQNTNGQDLSNQILLYLAEKIPNS